MQFYIFRLTLPLRDGQLQAWRGPQPVSQHAGHLNQMMSLDLWRHSGPGVAHPCTVVLACLLNIKD